MLNGPQIKTARELAGLTQQQVADRAGVSRVTVSDLERGMADARGSTLAAIQGVLEAEGLVFGRDGTVRHARTVKGKDKGGQEP